jgi:hypothetical protein
MSEQPEITQRDLRNRSEEIMDAVENGQAFTVTRGGHRIGEHRGDGAAMSVPPPHDSAEIPGLEFRHRRRGDEYAEAVTGDYPGGGGMLSMSAVSPASSSRSAGRRVRSWRT